MTWSKPSEWMHRILQVRGLPEVCRPGLGPPLAGEEVAAFRGRSLKADAYAYTFLDATYCKARVKGRVVSQRLWSSMRSVPTATGKSSASTSVTARTARSGPRSCAP